MAKILFFLALVGIASASKLGVQVINDIEEFKAQNPQIKPIPLRLQARDGVSDKYELGKREDGDKLVGQGSGKSSYTNPQDAHNLVSYPTLPQYGDGDVVTYVEIDVERSPDGSAKAYIVNGGIGQRKIQIMVEVKNTLYFSWKASVYGK